MNNLFVSQFSQNIKFNKMPFYFIVTISDINEGLVIFHITAMSNHLTQQSMKELGPLTVRSFI